MSTQTVPSLRLARLVKTDPETAFSAWTEPRHLMRWGAPEGLTVADAQVDLRVGGRYRIRMEGPEGQVYTAVGEYREIDRPRRLVYTWRWEEDARGAETLVTVEFHRRGDATEVVLTHDRFPSAEDRANHEQGWTSCLDRLERLYA